jgi:thiol:disulfide interchange protein DsbA
MNCDTIDSILDDHRSTRLSPAERQDLATHLAGCIRCAGASSAHDALAGEEIAEAPPELFARVVGIVSAARVHGYATRRRGRRVAVAAAAAAAAVALVAVAFVSRYGPFDFGAGDGGSPERAVVAAQAAPRFVAGRDYDVLAAAQRSTADAEGVAVTEFFMFPCFPCYAFEPELTRWSAEASGRAALTRVPVLFGAYTEAALHARAFYTAEALGKLDTMHAAFYDEIHVRGNPLSSREALAEFFARFGVDGATFDAAFDSGAVDARVQRAVVLSREYGIEAVPAFVVAGRYVTSPSMAGPQVLAVVDELVAEIRVRQAEEP